MIFNTTLLLVSILLVLPIARCSLYKRTNSSKIMNTSEYYLEDNESTERDSNIRSNDRQTAKESIEEKHQDEQDYMLESGIEMGDDYVVNEGEDRATEAPEMDPNAELVNENGQRDSGSDDTTTTSTTTTKISTTSRTTKPSRDAQVTKKVVRKDSKSNVESVKDSITNLIKMLDYNVEEKNSTEKKAICLESLQDSGIWCDGHIGKLNIRYYYERDSQSCECFLYYGCFGNKNNFMSVDECKDNCKEFGYNLSVNKTSDDCQISP